MVLIASLEIAPPDDPVDAGTGPPQTTLRPERGTAQHAATVSIETRARRQTRWMVAVDLSGGPRGGPQFPT